VLLNTRSHTLTACAAGLFIASALGGCATKGFVRTEVGAVDTKLQATQGQVDSAQATIGQHEVRIGELNSVAREALQRAEAAGKLAEGKFNYSVLLQDDAVKFPTNRAELSTEAQSRLAAIADKLKTDNMNVYIEVQGHTVPGEPARLGQARADAVRVFLNKQGVPLNRIASISYGSAVPEVPNSTPAGRAQNRRAVVMVLS